MKAGFSRNKPRLASGISTLAEPSLLYLLVLFFVLLPLINLTGLATGASVAYSLAQKTAEVTSRQSRFADALTTMQSTADVFNHNQFSKCANMVPVGGYAGTGVDLYIDATNFRTQAKQRFGPNTPVPAPVDLTSCVYRCTTKTTFEIRPRIDLSFIPLVGAIPGIGKPTVITYSASRTAENAAGLEEPATIQTDQHQLPVSGHRSQNTRQNIYESDIHESLNNQASTFSRRPTVVHHVKVFVTSQSLSQPAPPAQIHSDWNLASQRRTVAGEADQEQLEK